MAARDRDEDETRARFDPERRDEDPPPSDQEPADPTAEGPDESRAREPVSWTMREDPPSDEPRGEASSGAPSEAASGPIAPEREALENWNRDELLERAAELGLDVDPKISREALLDALSRERGRTSSQREDGQT